VIAIVNACKAGIWAYQWRIQPSGLDDSATAPCGLKTASKCTQTYHFGEKWFWG